MLAWWRAAGVDCDFADNARAWLADPASEAVGQAAATADLKAAAPVAPESALSLQGSAVSNSRESARIDYMGDSPPQSLADFQRWWMECELLGERGLYPRVAPRGVAGAKLMVVVPDPEAGDHAQLLSGPHGRLLANIIRAMGLSESEYYVACALPCHTPLADLASMAENGLDRVLGCHIALAAPQRVLLFGQGLTAFVSNKFTEDQQPLREINYVGVTPPTMITETLGSMLDMPRLKARFWRRWMEWAA